MATSWNSLLGSIKANLWLLVASCVAGFLALLVMGHIGLRSMELSAYQMGTGKDIVADILPPPLYLVEPHLLAYQMLDAPLAKRTAIATQLKALKQRYDMQNTYWLAHSQAVDGAVLASLLGEEKTHADAYWAHLELTWMPLALAGQDAQAKTAFAKLQSLYEAHRLGVDATVAIASAWADARFMDLSTTKRRMVWVLSIVAGLCIAIALVLFFTVGRRISNMLGAEPAELHREMLRLAKGDLAPSKRTSDERSVYGALQMAQESLQAQLIKTEHTNQELQKTLLELNHLVGTDLLTGLWSRRRMEETLVGEMDRHRRYGQPLSMLVIDVDAFKAVNDQFGHAIGDEVLVKLAAHIQLSLRVSDAIARWGGEEFLVLCPNTALDTATLLAERLREGLAATELQWVGHITISVGVAALGSEEPWHDWFKRADAALYQAKRQGRNQVQVAS